ncbi:glutaredoxin domain-containing protein [Polaromonas sp.]|uniref:glutaredoxin domain-containing protein n=1 Tax=Polaromonas sp. TaxID=1869339 RepID=UPI003FA7C05C
MRCITRSAMLLFWAFVAVTGAVAQNLYKSVGPDGRVVYSDRPPTEGRIEKTMRFENLPSSALPASASSYVEQLRRMRASATPSTPPTNGVVLYSATWCGYCKQAKAYLASKGVTYQEVDIDTNNGMTAFAQSGGGKGVPLLLASGQRVQGFSPAAYDALFANRK